MSNPFATCGNYRAQEYSGQYSSVFLNLPSIVGRSSIGLVSGSSNGLITDKFKLEGGLRASGDVEIDNDAPEIGHFKLHKRQLHPIISRWNFKMRLNDYFYYRNEN